MVKQNSKNSTSVDYIQRGKEAAAALFNVIEPDDILAELERFFCAKHEKPAKKDRLNLEKWREWGENAPVYDRKAWAVDAIRFAQWLMVHKTKRKTKNTVTFPPGLEDVGFLIAYIKGEKIPHRNKVFHEQNNFLMATENDGVFLAEIEQENSSLTINLMWMIPSWIANSTGDPPSIAQATKGACAAWVEHHEEYKGFHPLARSVEGLVLQLPKVESTSIYDARRPAAIMRFPRGNFTVELFSDSSPAGSLKRFADDSLLPQSIQMVLPCIQRKSVIRDPIKMLIAHVGGVPTTTRKGAVSPEVRVSIEAIMQMPPKECVAQVCIKLGDLIDRLYPNGFHWTNQGLKLIEAIYNIDYLRVPFINSSGKLQRGWAPVTLVTKELSRRDDDVVFLLTLPDDTTVGPMVEKKYVRLLGLLSAPKWQAYLALCDLFHRHGVKKGKDGKFYIADPTKPVERRNKKGYLLNAQGEVIRGTDGEPLIELYSPEAVGQLDREPNQWGIDQYPTVPFGDMPKACFPGREYKTTSERTEYINRAKQHLKELADKPSKAFGEKKGEEKAPNIIKINEHSEGWQFLPRESHIEVYRGISTGDE